MVAEQLHHRGDLGRLGRPGVGGAAGRAGTRRRLSPNAGSTSTQAGDDDDQRGGQPATVRSTTDRHRRTRADSPAGGTVTGSRPLAGSSSPSGWLRWVTRAGWLLSSRCIEDSETILTTSPVVGAWMIMPSPM